MNGLATFGQYTGENQGSLKESHSGENQGSIQESWNNHFAAFGSQNLDKIVED